MERQQLARIRMNPQTTLKLRLTAEGMLDDFLNLISLPLVKAILWLLSVAAAFVAGMVLYH